MQARHSMKWYIWSHYKHSAKETCLHTIWLGCMVWKFIENMQFSWFNKILCLKVKIEEVLNLVCVTSVCRIGTVAARSQRHLCHPFTNIAQWQFHTLGYCDTYIHLLQCLIHFSMILTHKTIFIDSSLVCFMIEICEGLTLLYFVCPCFNSWTDNSMVMMAINQLGCEDLEQCDYLLSNSRSFKLAHIYNNIALMFTSRLQRLIFFEDCGSERELIMIYFMVGWTE